MHQNRNVFAPCVYNLHGFTCSYHFGFPHCYYGSVINKEVKTKKGGKQNSD